MVYKVRCNENDTESAKLSWNDREVCLLSPTLFNLHVKFLTLEDLQERDKFEKEGDTNKVPKFADDEVSTASDENELHFMVDRLQNYNLNMNKTKVMKTNKETKNLTIRIRNTTEACKTI